MGRSNERRGEVWKHWQNRKKGIQELEMRDLQYGRRKLRTYMDVQSSMRRDKSEVGNSVARMEGRKRGRRLSPIDQGDPQKEIESGTIRICKNFHENGTVESGSIAGKRKRNCFCNIIEARQLFIDCDY